MPTELLKLENVSLGYHGRPVLHDLNFSVNEGDFLGVMGPNGSGKTTLLKAMLGLLKPISGSIEAKRNGAPLTVGYVPQRERLDPHFPLTALDVAVMGRFGKLGPLRRAHAQDREIARNCLSMVRMADRADRAYRQLSGGQQQRVLIARALAGEPEVLLLDEPTNGMDIEAERAIMELLIELQQIRSTTIVFVTHLLSTIQQYARRVALITRRGGLMVGDKTVMLAPQTLAQAYAEGA